MRKIISLLSILAFSFTFAYAEEPLNFDEQNINSEFDQINKIERYVQQNQNVTLEELKANNSELLDGINLSAENSSAVMSGDMPLNIPPFLWGCVFGIIGILLVYIMSDSDKDMTKKAVLGCLIGWGAGILIYLIAVGSIFGAAASAI